MRLFFLAALLVSAAPSISAAEETAAPATSAGVTKDAGPNSHLAAAVRLYQKLDLDAAIAELQLAEDGAKDSEDDRVQVLIYRGLIYSETGKLSAASDQFKRALAIRPWAEVPDGTSPRIAELPDAARVEERLGDLARQRDFVPFRIAFSVAELGRELIREAQRAGSCPEVASRFAVQLALRQAARDHSPGPYFAVRNHAGYARALGDLLAALSEGLLEPEELAALDVGGRALALGRTLAEARDALGRVGLADPHRALRLAVEHVERGGALPRELADAAALEFDCVLDWTPLRLRLAKALATRLRVRIRLPWSGGRSDLTDPLEPTLRAIEKLVEPAPELELFDPAEQAPALAPFLRRLFAADGAP